MNRAETIKEIRTAMKKRTGKSWSVTGGRGSAWGWLTITSPPYKRREGFGYLTVGDQADLGHALGLGDTVHRQGVTVPPNNDFWDEYIDRANGRTQVKYGVADWD